MSSLKEQKENLEQIISNLAIINTLMQSSIIKTIQSQKKYTYLLNRYHVAQKIWKDIKFKEEVTIVMGSDLGLCGRYNLDLKESKANYYIGNKQKKQSIWLGELSNFESFKSKLDFVKKEKLLPIFYCNSLSKLFSLKLEGEKSIDEDLIIECDLNNTDIFYDIFFEFVYWICTYNENTIRFMKTQSIKTNGKEIEKEASLKIFKTRQLLLTQELIASKSK